jgi:DNA-binding beta-propeller fold protein YncE
MRVGAVIVLTLGLVLSELHAQQPVAQLRAIDLPHVEGRIDHMAFDPATQRLYVAALGNNTVEIVDTRAGTHLRSLMGFQEPQGIAVASDMNVIAVANGSGSGLQFLSADGTQRTATVRLGDDSDNVRYDPAAKRFYVGFGRGALAAVGVRDARVLSEIALAGHPESFQLERSRPRVFVNVPSANQIAVLDRSAMKVIATWPVRTATANFPMALDEAGHRVFVGCRRPARALVYDSNNGKELGAVDIVGDTDDLFFDSQRRRLYVSGGEGYLDVLQDQGANGFSRIAHVKTAAGARTSLFVPEQSRLYLAVPHRGSQKAEIRIYDIR